MEKYSECRECHNEFTESEKEFFPCPCLYQVCTFCYKDLKETNRKCPGCNHPYDPKNLKEFSPEKRAELIRKEMEKQKKEKSKKRKVLGTKVKDTKTTQIKNLQKYQNIRVIQKELVYVIGLSPTLSVEETLRKGEYFGQYGRIVKVVLNKNHVYNPKGHIGPCFSAYLTYASSREASIAILAVDQFVIHNRMLRASFGTTKYCSHFLKGQSCPNKDCLYLHKIKTDCDTISKDDTTNNKSIFIEQQRIAFNLAGVEIMSIKEFKMSLKRFAPTSGISFLPAPEIIYKKKFAFIFKKPPSQPFKSESPENHMAIKYQTKENKSVSKSPSFPVQKYKQARDTSELLEEEPLQTDIKEFKDYEYKEVSNEPSSENKATPINKPNPISTTNKTPTTNNTANTVPVNTIKATLNKFDDDDDDFTEVVKKRKSENKENEMDKEDKTHLDSEKEKEREKDRNLLSKAHAGNTNPSSSLSVKKSNKSSNANGSNIKKQNKQIPTSKQKKEESLQDIREKTNKSSDSAGVESSPSTIKPPSTINTINTKHSRNSIHTQNPKITHTNKTPSASNPSSKLHFSTNPSTTAVSTTNTNPINTINTINTVNSVNSVKGVREGRENKSKRNHKSKTQQLQQQKATSSHQIPSSSTQIKPNDDFKSPKIASANNHQLNINQVLVSSKHSKLPKQESANNPPDRFLLPASKDVVGNKTAVSAGAGAGMANSQTEKKRKAKSKLQSNIANLSNTIPKQKKTLQKTQSTENGIKFLKPLNSRFTFAQSESGSISPRMKQSSSSLDGNNTNTNRNSYEIPQYIDNVLQMELLPSFSQTLQKDGITHANSCHADFNNPIPPLELDPAILDIIHKETDDGLKFDHNWLGELFSSSITAASAAASSNYSAPKQINQPFDGKMGFGPIFNGNIASMPLVNNRFSSPVHTNQLNHFNYYTSPIIRDKTRISDILKKSPKTMSPNEENYNIIQTLFDGKNNFLNIVQNNKKKVSRNDQRKNKFKSIDYEEELILKRHNTIDSAPDNKLLNPSAYWEGSNQEGEIRHQMLNKEPEDGNGKTKDEKINENPDGLNQEGKVELNSEINIEERGKIKERKESEAEIDEALDYILSKSDEILFNKENTLNSQSNPNKQ